MSECKWKKRLAIAFVILIFSVISATSIHPYQYITSEKLAFIKSAVDGNLYPEDYLLKEKQYYYSYFNMILGIFVKYLRIDLPVLLFAAYMFSLYMTFLGVYCIASALFRRTEVGLLALFFLLLGNKITLAGVSVLGISFTEQVAALPILLFSMYFFFRERYLISFLFQGFAFLIHPLSTSYVVAMLSVSALLEIGQIGVKKLMICFAAFTVMISPILIWKMADSPGSLNMFHADPEWLELMKLRSSHHVFPFSWDRSDFLREGLLLLTFFVSWKYRPSSARNRVVLYAVAAILGLWIIGTIFTEFLPLPVVIQFQLFRSSTWIVFFTVVYFANYFITSIETEKSISAKAAVIFIALGIFFGPVYWWKYAYAAFLTLAVFIISCYAFYRQNMPLRYVASASVTIVLLLGCGYMAGNNFHFSINNVQERNWLAVQKWAKENTDVEDLFIVPPNIASFRDESERAIYGDWKDGTQMFFNPAFGYEWVRRMKNLGYRESMTIKSFDRLNELEESFKNLSESDFFKIANDSAAKSRDIFLVMFNEKNILKFPELYRNEKFIVYKVSPLPDMVRY